MEFTRIAKDIEYLEKNIQELTDSDLIYTDFILKISDTDVKTAVLKALNNLLETKVKSAREYLNTKY